MNKKSSLFTPIYQTIIGCFWVFIFCADFFYPPDLGLIVFLHGLCAVTGVISAITHWIRYKKDSISKGDKD